MRKKSKRLSKNRLSAADTLQGMSSRSYYAHKKLSGQLINMAKAYLDADIWKKLDRNKPVGKNQGMRILAAIRQAAVNVCPDFPFEYPYLNITVESSNLPTKKIINVKAVAIRQIPHVDTPDGPVYFGHKNKTVTIKEVTGRLGFAKHAIERLFERRTELDNVHLIKTDMVLHLLDVLALHSTIKYASDSRPYLSFLFTSEDNEGYLPLEQRTVNRSEETVWAAKTFLSNEMLDENMRSDLPTIQELVGMLKLGE